MYMISPVVVGWRFFFVVHTVPSLFIFFNTRHAAARASSCILRLDFLFVSTAGPSVICLSAKSMRTAKRKMNLRPYISLETF